MESPPSAKKVAVEAAAQLTGDEATQYDRQIRLWGVDAQRRLGAANVLVIGATGLSAELCKNLVLAGIASLTLSDDTMTTVDDLSAQFLLGPDDIGHPRALRAVPGICRLNPNVKVAADLEAFGLKSEAYFAQFNLVCMTTGSPSEQAVVNDKCRAAGVKFCCGRSFGYNGFVFVDFLEHSFVEEEHVAAVAATAHAPAVKAHTKKTTLVESFVPFSAVLGSPQPKLRVNRTSPVFFQLLVWHAFFQAHGRSPTASDGELLVICKTAALQGAQLALTALPDTAAKDIGASLVCEFAPVSAILGGILTGEAVKAISGKDRPQNNCLFFEGATSLGLLHRLP